MLKRMIGRAMLLTAILGSPHAFAQQDRLDSFFSEVQSHRVRSNAEVERFLAVSEELSAASETVVKTALPEILTFSHSSDIRTRSYAAVFLSTLALRPDGSIILSKAVDDVLRLLTDSDQELQHVAVAIIDYVIRREGTDDKRYAAALNAFISRSDATQQTQAEIAGPLLSLQGAGAIDPTAIRSIDRFIQRSDLSDEVRIALLRSLTTMGNIPDEISTSLAAYGDSPNSNVRAAVVKAYIDCSMDSAPKRVLKSEVQKMADNPREEPEIRAQAEDALAKG